MNPEAGTSGRRHRRAQLVERGAAAAAALALSLGVIGPGGAAGDPGADRIFLVDVSRSCTADPATAIAAAGIEVPRVRFAAGDRVAMIAFGAGTQVVLAPVASGEAGSGLAAAIAAWAPAPGVDLGAASDLGAGIRRAVDLAGAGRAVEITVFGDGRYAADAAAPGGLTGRRVAVIDGGSLLPPPEDVRIELAGPLPRVRAGEPTAGALRIAGHWIGPRRVTVRSGSAAIDVPLAAGRAEIVTLELHPEAGAATVEVVLVDSGGPDADRSDDRLVIPVEDRGRRRVAVVGAGAAELARRFEEWIPEIQATAAESFDPALLAGSEVLVLADLAFGGPTFDEPHAIALSRAVFESGLGVVALGGPRSFRPGGWGASAALEALLPLSSRPPRDRDLALLLDTSGSMEADDRLGRAVDATLALARALGPGDLLQVHPFATGPGPAVPAIPAPGPEVARRHGIELRNLVPRGGTRLAPAIDAALARWPRTGTGDRQAVLVILSDFRDAGLEGPAGAIAASALGARLRAAGARAIAVLLDPEASTRERAAALAERVVESGEVTPRLLLDSVEGDGFATEPTAVVWRGPALGATGPLAAWNRVRQGPGAMVILETGDAAPILAEARRGAGRVVACAAANPPAAPWVAGLFALAVRRVMPAPADVWSATWSGSWIEITGPPGGPATLALAGGGGRIVLEERAAGRWIGSGLPAHADGSSAALLGPGDQVVARVPIPPRPWAEYVARRPFAAVPPPRPELPGSPCRWPFGAAAAALLALVAGTRSVRR